MALKSEASFKEYLKKLSDETIIRYYSDVEYSPFPVLVIQEYTRRFEQKTKTEILKDLKYPPFSLEPIFTLVSPT